VSEGNPSFRSERVRCPRVHGVWLLLKVPGTICLFDEHEATLLKELASVFVTLERLKTEGI